MQLRTRTWIAISLGCFLAAYLFWQLAGSLERRDNASAARKRAEAAGQPPSAGEPGTGPQSSAASAPTNGVPLPASVPAASAATNSAARKEPFPYRVSNTPKSVNELGRSDQAILLRNALIDSSAPVNLAIPPHLRAAGDPGAYVVQSRGPLTDGFRAQLAQAGAQIISYVPNNAYLVRASAAVAQQLGALPGTQAVLGWEPYYKLEAALLALAVEQKPLPVDARLNVVAFPDAADDVRQALTQAGIEINGEERTPFGAMFVVRPSSDVLPMLAGLPGVQGLERHLPRKPANDLARARVKASANVGPDSGTSANYRGLTGAGVKVNVNDTGVDATHPALSGRVTADSPFTLQDFDGHGTHVSGIIAGNGAGGPDGRKVSGSFSNSNYRGMAPSASIFAMPIDLNFGPFTSETYLQETAAANDAIISNNSWGYPGANDYTFSSASWDAAARDALPGVTGPQPLTLVFAAGNSGFGQDDGMGGIPGTISAPATGKNVITVGAIESYRNITNEFTEVVDDNGTMVTNVYTPFLGMTDSSNQVTRFSSRGNVGVGIEGDGGRFKPDVMAPGAMIVSLRSQQAALPDSLTNVIPNNIFDQKLGPGQTNLYAVFVPFDGFRMVIQVISNRLSPAPFPPLIIKVGAGGLPNPAGRAFINQADLAVTPGIYFYTIANTNRIDVRFDIRTFVVVRAEPPIGYFEVLRELNETTAPNYRFESGTSQATPVVTGVIALMQEFFLTTFGMTNSPALTKALLINGARSLENDYDFQIDPTVNAQGWGLINATNSMPEGSGGVVSGDGGNASGALIFYEQAPGKALATGQSVTREITVPVLARDYPLRITLAWTDPPANPSVGIKLVNDLDLIVTDLSDGQIYYGNNFDGGATFTSATASNAPPKTDIVNNVENVYLNRGLNGRYLVTVRATRVNVNAVPQNLTSVAQDYALVISTERTGGVGAGLTVSDQPQGYNPAPLVTVVTNGVALLNQRVGANSPLILSTNGGSNQWHFFVVTNMLPPSDPNYGNNSLATHIAFTTFLPPNLSIPRFSEQADIDLYVSDDPNITNLNTAVISASRKSLRRGGTESVVINNAIPGALYYAGVKSEDQQAANFGFFAISSSLPFSGTDSDGNVTATGFPFGSNIPDGTPDKPQAALIFAFVNEEVQIDNIIVTNILSHDSGGDLLGNLSHNNQFAVLNNHRSFQGNNLLWVYDDSDSGEIDISQPVDGPGSLRNFVGEEAGGVWQLTMIDNSPFHTGRVERLSLEITPHLDALTDGTGINRRILPGRWTFTFVDVPAQATNMSVCVLPQGGPVEVYIRRGRFPTRTLFDTFGEIPVEGGCVDLGRRDSPPLSAGRYIIGVFNPNLVEVTVNISVTLGLDLNRSDSFTYRSGGALPILDDAVGVSAINVNRDQLIADVSVGVRIDHPRVSDLVLHLVSPSGTRLLLAENRGGPNGADYGSGALQTNTFPVQTSGGAAANTNILAVTDTQGTIEIQYQFFTVGDTLRIYYENNLLFDSSLTSGAGTFAVDYGPGTSTNIVIIVNEGNNPNGSTLWNYTATVLSGYVFATFTENTNLAKLPIKFAPPPFTIPNGSTNYLVTNAVVLDDSFEDPPYRRVFAGQIFSGWQVGVNEIEVLPTLPFAPFFIQPDTGDLFIDISGFVPGTVFTNLVTQPGRDYLVSFAYARNNSNPDAVSADVRINGVNALSLVAPPGVATNWVYTNFAFTATSSLTRLELVSTTIGTRDDASAVFFDSFTAVQVDQRTDTGIYYLPEEPLKPFFGENAFGEWKLEVWDNRLGGAVTGASLLSWKMNIVFVNTNPPAITLTNGLSYCSTLGTNETAFFIVNVPVKAKGVTNVIFASSDVSLIFQQYGLPTGQQPPDTFFQNNVLSGVTGLGTNGWTSHNIDRTILRSSNSYPVLQRGRRYYLAVQNKAPGSNSFCLQADLVLPGNVIPLTDGVPFCGALGFTFTTNVVGAQTFSFNVSTGAIQATFQTFNTSGNVDLFVRYGTNFTNFAALLTLATNYPYSSTNLGTGREIVRVATNSRPFALTNGLWYIAVVNREASNVSYCVVAKQILASNIVTLTNALTYTATNDGGGIGALVPVDYYHFPVSAGSLRAQFELLQPSGDVTLVLKKDLPLPDLLDSTYISARGGASDELVFLFDYSTPVALTNGDWYLGVVNATGTTNVYTAQVTEYPVYGTNFEFSTSMVLTGALCLTWTNALTNATYYVQGADSPNPPYWVPVPPSIRATTSNLTWCVPVPAPFSNLRLTEGLVPAIYPALSNLDGTPLPTNGFGVRWSAPADQRFRLEASEPLTPLSWQALETNFISTNGLFEYLDTGTNTGGLGPYRFYRFLQLP